MALECNMTHHPNRGWRIRGNTTRAVIQRRTDPLELTMTLEQRPDGRRALTLRALHQNTEMGDPPTATNT